MRRSTLLLRDERIRRLLYTVMHEPVRILRTNNPLETEGFPEIRLELLFRRSLNGGQRGPLRAVPKAGQALQGFLGDEREPAQLGDHEVDDVIRVPSGADRVEIPAPSGIARLEDNQ